MWRRGPSWRQYARFLGADPRADVDDELRFHLEELERQFRRDGMSPAEARRAAEAQFGDFEGTRSVLHPQSMKIHHRALRAEWWRGLGNDLRLAARKLIRQPGFTAIALLTLSLGIGANTAIFSIVNSVLLRPLAYRDPQQLYLIREIVPAMVKTYPTVPANLNNYLRWRRQVGAFEQVAIVDRSAMVLSGAGDPLELQGAQASANLFETLGVKPALGRGFRAEEDLPGHDHVVMLTDGTWRNRFHGDSTLIGKSITLDAQPYTVIGILPASFRFPTGDQLGALVQFGLRAEYFKPLGLDPAQFAVFGEFDFAAIGRLKPGVTPAQALASLNMVQRQLASEVGDSSDFKAVMLPLESQITGPARRGLFLLLGGVGAVLLIVCVNLANLFLSRVPGRMHEAAIRTALGASRSRLARQLLLESALIAIVGGALGVVLTVAGLHALVALAPPTLPRLDEVGVDARVLIFASLLSVGTGLFFGLLPAWRVAHAVPQQALKAGELRSSEGRGVRQMRSALISAEVALSTLLLVVAGLLAGSLVRLLHVNTGFVADHALTAGVELPARSFPDAVQRQQFLQRMVDSLDAIPGVRSTGWVSRLPLTGETSVSGIALPGHENDPTAPLANYRIASLDYFTAAGIAIRHGRAFTVADRGRDVVIVSQSAADRLWPGESAIGKPCVTMWGEPRQAEVIGVSADIPSLRLDGPAPATLYLPEWSRPMAYHTSATLVVRSTGDPLRLAATVRRIVRNGSPDVAITSLKPMTEVVSDSVVGRRFQLLLASVFAMSALFLAVIGIYGVVTYSVEQRRRELGIRMAMGAGAKDVWWLVVTGGMVPVLIGLFAGIAGALLVGRLIASLLFGEQPYDLVTMGGVTALIGLTAAIACAIPAARATRLDPAAVWRTE
jgi:predicted permease